MQRSHRAIGLVFVLAGAFLALAPAAGAVQEEKVTICHRTNSVTNPYTNPTVALSAVDGEGKNDHTFHLGPVFDFDDPDQYEPPHNDDEWGDIIPPTPGNPDGVNWDDDGQAIWNAGCRNPEAPEPESTLEIVKAVDGDAAPEEWSFEFEGFGGDFTLDDETTSTGAMGVAGDQRHRVIETDDGDADATEVECSGTDAYALQEMTLIVFVPLDTAVVCTFTNTFDPTSPPETSLEIVKEVDGTGAPAQWSFDFEGPGEGSFTLDDEESTTGPEAVSGGQRYRVTETDAGDADATTVGCEGTDIAFAEVADPDGPTVVVFVPQGTNAVCTFTNRFDAPPVIPPPPVAPAQASLQIVKQVTGDVPDSWSFDFTGDAGAFALTNTTSSETQTELSPGTYTVTEVAVDGTELVDVSCTDETAVYDEDSRSVVVDLSAGEFVQCTFTNDFGAVLGVEVVRTPTPDPVVTPVEVQTPEVLPDEVVTLPRTGTETTDLAAIGVAFLLLGVAWTGLGEVTARQRA